MHLTVAFPHLNTMQRLCGKKGKKWMIKKTGLQKLKMPNWIFYTTNSITHVSIMQLCLKQRLLRANFLVFWHNHNLILTSIHASPLLHYTHFNKTRYKSVSFSQQIYDHVFPSTEWSGTLLITELISKALWYRDLQWSWLLPQRLQEFFGGTTWTTKIQVLHCMSSASYKCLCFLSIVAKTVS